MKVSVWNTWKGAPIWSAGFRVFFWLAALNTATSLLFWLAYLSGLVRGAHGWPAQSLHAHEMLHGTVIPVIAGFLLTAVPNWSGTRPLRGTAIAGLVSLWLAGRVVLSPIVLADDSLPQVLVALIDGAFLPVFTLAVGIPIVLSRKVSNFSVLFVLVALALANLAMHLGVILSDTSLLRLGVYGSVYLIIGLILIISGRVVPLFTRHALGRAGVSVDLPGNRWFGPLALCAAGLACMLDLASPDSAAGGMAALVAAPFLVMRQLSWKPGYATGYPMLWVLHAGHGWIAMGFACHGAAVLSGLLPVSSALHAFTAGAMGCMILGMMARVSLGHTGRPVEASGMTIAAFVAVILAAIVRVFGPLIEPLQGLPSLLMSGTAFALAYLIFAVQYTPVLWKERSTPDHVGTIDAGECRRKIQKKDAEEN